MLPITDPIFAFTLLALIILVSPILYERWRIPDLVLLLGFGALLGPNGLYVLERSTAVTLLGSVGMVFIMFLAGLEIDLYRFSRGYKKSIVFGLLTFGIPQALGTLAGLYILNMDLKTSLLLASMFASHTLLAYPLAGRLGIARSEPVATTVGATMITDVLALLVLAIIADSARGVELTASFWISIVCGMLGLTFLILKGVPYIARWFFQQVSEKSNAQFLFVMVILCGGAYLSNFARVEPIVGAFLTGIAFNRLIPEHSPLMSRMTFAGNTLFIPFFLISVGMLVDVRIMFSGTRSLIVGATMVGMVVLTKFLAATAASKLLGYSRSEGRVMFGLSVVQAAATLAAVLIGHELKIFDDAVLNGAIAMILVSCPLGFWAVDHYGRQMTVDAPVKTVPVRSEQRLLLTVANPDTVTQLLDLTFLLRNKARPGGIYPLTVVKESANTDEAVARGEALLGLCSAHAASADLSVTPVLRVSQNISDGIIQAARESRASMVLVGWSADQSASVRIFGTVMHHLVEHCSSRLMFCRLTRPLNTTRRVLIPFQAMASKLRDLPALARDIKNLSHQIGAEIRIYSTTADAATLLPLLKNTTPSCRITSVEVSSWDAIKQ
ncbi:MAG: cation:proton antiporter, partial [Kiritimatiellaceae bacterium]|nr:cation:proton antiporter [Kiritimatiellaceae bacterium]